MSKVWVTRNKGHGKGWVKMWDVKPKESDSGEFTPTIKNEWSEYYYVSTFRKLYHFTPKKGSCKQMNLSLTDIK